MNGRLLYLNCASGVSGDMIVGGLLHLGADFKLMREAVDSMDLGPVKISRRRVKKGHLSAVSFIVDIKKGSAVLDTMKDVRKTLAKASLPRELNEKCAAAFRKLAEAEGEAHGIVPEKVHFHELGSSDTIIDIVCTVVGLSTLGVVDLMVSPVNVGHGMVRTAHGTFPVPAPATANLLSGFDIFSDGEAGEKATPTGATILATFGHRIDGIPRMTVTKSGYGAGNADYMKSVNIVQMILGEPAVDWEYDQSIVIECNIDDMNPQVYPYLARKLLKEGAQDVFISPVVMKKGRPGYKVSLLAAPEKVVPLGEVLMSESTTIGLRQWPVGRLKASRKIRKMVTPWGEVAVKVINAGGNRRAVPEFEDCRRVAENTGRPLLEIMSALGKMASSKFEDNKDSKENE